MKSNLFWKFTLILRLCGLHVFCLCLQQYLHVFHIYLQSSLCFVPHFCFTHQLVHLDVDIYMHIHSVCTFFFPILCSSWSIHTEMVIVKRMGFWPCCKFFLVCLVCLLMLTWVQAPEYEHTLKGIHWNGFTVRVSGTRVKSSSETVCLETAGSLVPVKITLLATQCYLKTNELWHSYYNNYC